jgi:hypothetical protein
MVMRGGPNSYKRGGFAWIMLSLALKQAIDLNIRITSLRVGGI